MASQFDTSPILAALEAARHELVTLNGLIAADGAAPNETFPIDCTNVLIMVDEALAIVLGNTDTRPS